MPVAGGMAPPAMANASIFASSHKLQISQLDVGQQIQSALEKSLNYSNLGIGLKVSNCNSFISAAYCKLAFRQAQEGATKPSSTKFSNSSCSQGDIITVKCQLFMSIPTAINASITSHALSPQETPQYFISAAFKLAFKPTPTNPRKCNHSLTH
jgi:hypothetical protein